jgi:ferredoxin-NADP reductase
MNEPHIWWYITRSSATIAWVLLTANVLWGILLSTRIMRKIDNPAWLQDLHKYFGGTAIAMVALHLVTLMLDGWLSFTPAEVLIPFATDFKALPVALGIIAFYLMLVVQGTSLIMTRLPRRFWKGVHFSSYATLLLVAFHSGLTGTDISALWYRILSFSLIGIVTAAIILRIIVRTGANEPTTVSATSDAGAGAGAGSGAVSGVATATATATKAPAARTSTARVAPSPVPSAVAVMNSGQADTATMVVASATPVAAGVLGITLVPLGGGTLPSWQPGAHITLHLSNGLERQYSLCGDPANRHQYEIAVLRAADSAGGSEWIHAQVVPGMTIEVSGPLNHFAIEAAKDYLFVAGGIGITPIKAMIESLPIQRGWSLVYLGRSRTTMAFVDELIERYPDHVSVLASDEPPTGISVIDVAAATKAEVYCCGPESLMAALADVVPSDRMHFERFEPVDRTSGVEVSAVEVTAKRSKKTFSVPAGESILDALEENGVALIGSCRKGVCGTCEVRVVSGVPQHLDSVMEDSEKDDLQVMYPCVSRSKTPELVLDV